MTNVVVSVSLWICHKVFDCVHLHIWPFHMTLFSINSSLIFPETHSEGRYCCCFIPLFIAVWCIVSTFTCIYLAKTTFSASKNKKKLMHKNPQRVVEKTDIKTDICVKFWVFAAAFNHEICWSN